MSGSSVGQYPTSLWFWNNPPTPDLQFAPIYARAASGDLRALVDFYTQHWDDPGDAFYQTIGYLATRGNPQELNAVQEMMTICRRGGPRASSMARRESAKGLEKRFLPIAQEASKWISQQRNSDESHGHGFVSREKLWQKYIDENVGSETPLGLRKQLMDEFGPEEPTPETMARALGLTNKELRAKLRSNLRAVAEYYFSRGIVPKSLFFTLARSAHGKISPSIAVRRLAEKIAI